MLVCFELFHASHSLHPWLFVLLFTLNYLGAQLTPFTVKVPLLEHRKLRWA